MGGVVSVELPVSGAFAEEERDGGIEQYEEDRPDDEFRLRTPQVVTIRAFPSGESLPRASNSGKSSPLFDAEGCRQLADSDDTLRQTMTPGSMLHLIAQTYTPSSIEESFAASNSNSSA